MIDPPFTQEIANETMKQIVKSSVLKKETLIVIESSQHEVIKDVYPPFSLFDRRYFGDKLLSFFKTTSSSK